MNTALRRTLGLGLLGTLLLSGCTAPTGNSDRPAPGNSGSPNTQEPGSAAPTTPAPSPTTPDPQEELRKEAEALADSMNLVEQAGSLVMAGVSADGASAAQVEALKKQGISNVFLRGRSQLSHSQISSHVKELHDSLAANVPEDLPVWVATDQEGGFVRVLQGQGFSELPTAMKQGAWDKETLQAEISELGEELADAGINVNLAPVADVVPASLGTGNAPIGKFGRQYANNAKDVAASILVANEELADAGVQPVVKHFPGLGRVSLNTDTHAQVTDTKIDAGSADLEPFAAAIDQDLAWVMISNARYTQLDKENDAPFSKKIVTGLLREDLGYKRLIISDDLCDAKQVSAVPVGQRAVEFVQAGGTMPLCVDESKALTMAKTLAKQAGEDEKLAEQVREAAILILSEKLRMQQ
ncbi:glycoside hydrolase family 3 N-terminal domain-containing protein [Glutamicibacter arilaitensis]|uniref:glycoside hydrolase family 3 N-terminal domain-containing protein n=1 Tax=Glutamicibacter arilaitensis TaxID=256701 RepID=UPI00384D6602